MEDAGNVIGVLAFVLLAGAIFIKLCADVGKW